MNFQSKATDLMKPVWIRWNIFDADTLLPLTCGAVSLGFGLGLFCQAFLQSLLFDSNPCNLLDNLTLSRPLKLKLNNLSSISCLRHVFIAHFQYLNHSFTNGTFMNIDIFFFLSRSFIVCPANAQCMSFVYER